MDPYFHYCFITFFFLFLFSVGKSNTSEVHYSYRDIVAKGNLITQMDYFIDAPFAEGELDSLQMGLQKMVPVLKRMDISIKIQ